MVLRRDWRRQRYESHSGIFVTKNEQEFRRGLMGPTLGARVSLDRVTRTSIFALKRYLSERSLQAKLDCRDTVYSCPVLASIKALRERPLNFCRTESGIFFNAGRIFVSHSSRRLSTYSV